MSKQLGFYFEQKHCVGCGACQVACKDKSNLEAGQNFRKVYEVTGGSYTRKGNAVIPQVYSFWNSISCNHCINPSCTKSCPTGALQKRPEDGIVHIEQDKCVGCGLCAKSCPYEAIQINSTTKKAEKCDFCMDLLKEGKKPVCVTSCPLRILDCDSLDILQEKYGNVSETKGMPSKEITQPALVISPHADAVIK